MENTWLQTKMFPKTRYWFVQKSELNFLNKKKKHACKCFKSATSVQLENLYNKTLLKGWEALSLREKNSLSNSFVLLNTGLRGEQEC